MRKAFYTFVLSLLMAMTLSSQTVVDIIVNSNDHNTLEAAVIAAELADDLSGEGPFTVFAPTDGAFEALPDGTVDALLQDPTGNLAKILLYHVASGTALSTDLSHGQTVTTLLGQNIEVSVNNEGVFINEARVILADIPAENGVVHVIDAVILPPAATVVDVVVNSPVHNTLEAAVIAAELADDLSGAGPFTVFAPTDEAFEALPDGTVDALLQDPTGDLAKILLYHVAGGEALSSSLANGQAVTTLLGQGIEVTINNNGVFINDAQVSIADIRTFNGVVHVIDAVILPPAATVVDVVVNSPVHNTLEAAVIAAELADDLSGEGPFTVFAPTDEAFEALPDGTVDALLQDPTGDLAKILLYHVAAGEALSSSLADGQAVTTLLGQGIEVTINNEGVFINDAQVGIADIRTFNGVVHVIDAVILPPAATVVDVVVNSEVHNTLEAAVIAAELADDLSGEGPFTVFAPTDEAFEALLDGTVDALLQDPTGDLAKILLYHVVSGEALSSSLTDGQTITTLLEQDIEVSINNDGVFINDAQVSIADIRTFNGVVHVIDAVLLPNLSAVRDLEKVSLSIYPNPVSDQLVIELPQSLLNARTNAQLLDARGNIVQEWRIDNINSSLDVQNYPTGTYFLLIQTNERYSINKLVIK
ncbi:MAG: fasciclin domain-containing protein [Chitinophagales bacterium]|nr:fasciclin domain-containing protein [Chitinophagales bacterium]